MPNTTETIVATIATFATGWELAKLYKENHESPFYDLLTQEIYEDFVSKYSLYIDRSEKPIIWDIDIVNVKEKKKIRPKFGANSLDHSITTYKLMIQTLENYQSDEINIHYKNILEYIVELFESIKKKHKEQPDVDWLVFYYPPYYHYYFHYKFNCCQLAPRLDGPEIMFFTEIADSILSNFVKSHHYKTIEKRTNYINFVSNGAIDKHRKTDNDIVSTTLDLILDQYKCLEKITKSRDLNKDIPQSIIDMLRSIEFLNTRSLHLTYCLLEGSKKDFDMDEFLKNYLKEAQATNDHSLGTKLSSALESIKMNDVYVPSELNRTVLNRTLNTTLTNVNQNDSVLLNSKRSGIKDFFDTSEQKMIVYNCTIEILRDIFRLYFYSENLRSINKALNLMGVNWMVTNQPTKLSIETQLEITKFTFQRLLKNCESYTKIYDKAISNHRKNHKKKNDDPIYENTHKAIIKYRALLISDDSMETLLNDSYNKIKSLIQHNNHDIDQINEENKEVLIMWYDSVLDSISLETDSEQEKYANTKQQLQNALNELRDNKNTENNDSMPKFITDTLTILNTPDNETIAEAEVLDEEHVWKSNVLKEIFENISWKYNTKNKNFINFCRKIKTTIFKIETKQGITAISLNIVETILRNFAKRHEKICYPSPPIYIQPIQAINIIGENNMLRFINDQEQLSIEIGSESNLELLGLQAQHEAKLMAAKLEGEELHSEFMELQEKIKSYLPNQPAKNNA